MALAMRAAASSVVASGFSAKMFLPARAARSTNSVCRASFAANDDAGHFGVGQNRLDVGDLRAQFVRRVFGRARASSSWTYLQLTSSRSLMVLMKPGVWIWATPRKAVICINELGS